MNDLLSIVFYLGVLYVSFYLGRKYQSKLIFDSIKESCKKEGLIIKNETPNSFKAE